MDEKTRHFTEEVELLETFGDVSLIYHIIVVWNMNRRLFQGKLFQFGAISIKVIKLYENQINFSLVFTSK